MDKEHRRKFKDLCGDMPEGYLEEQEGQCARTE